MLKLKPLDLYHRYGDVYKSTSMFAECFIIADYDAVVAAYLDGGTFSSSGAFPPQFITFFGENASINLDGEPLKYIRKNLAPVFSANKVASYESTIRKSTNAFFENLKETVEKSQQPVVLEPLLRQHFLRVILSISTSVPIEETMQTSFSLSVVEAELKVMFKSFLTPRFGPVHDQAMRSLKKLLDLIRPILIERLTRDEDIIRSMRTDSVSQQTAPARAGQIDMFTIFAAICGLPTGDEALKLLEENPDAFEGPCKQALGTWFAGFHTTAGSTHIVLSKLYSLDKSVMAALKEEQAQIAEVTIEDLMRGMPVLDSFLNEVFRITPMAARHFRKTTRDIEVLGHFIPKNSLVLLDVMSAQRSSKYFEDPDTFKLDRFLSNSVSPAPSSMLLGFGATGGPHFCLGAMLAKLEMKVFFSTLLREYELDIVEPKKKGYRTVPEMAPSEPVRVRAVRKLSTE